MSKVLFTEPAEYDLVSIEDYIRDILKNPTSAIRVVDDIIKESYLLELIGTIFCNQKMQIGAAVGMWLVEFYSVFNVE